MRHIGRTNTGARCAIIDMQPPIGGDKAFIVITDALPQRFHDALMHVLESTEGQQAENLGFVLARHLMPDTGESVIQALNASAKIVSYPTNKVYMVPPAPHQPELLSEVLIKMGRSSPNQQQVGNDWETNKFNPHINNQQAESSENAKSIARGLLMEAEMLEADAQKKRNAAYQKDPALRQQQPRHQEKIPQTQVGNMSPPASSYYAPEASQKIDIASAYKPESLVDSPFFPEKAKQPNPMEDRMSNLEKTLGSMMGMISKLAPAAPAAEQEPRITSTVQLETEVEAS